MQQSMGDSFHSPYPVALKWALFCDHWPNAYEENEVNVPSALFLKMYQIQECQCDLADISCPRQYISFSHIIHSAGLGLWVNLERVF